jgi:hypothetical protein
MVPACARFEPASTVATWALLVLQLTPPAQKTLIKNFLSDAVNHLQKRIFPSFARSHSRSPGTTVHRASRQENACSLSLQSQKGCSANKECRRCRCLLIFFTSRAGASFCRLADFGWHSRLQQQQALQLLQRYYWPAD